MRHFLTLLIAVINEEHGKKSQVLKYHHTERACRVVSIPKGDRGPNSIIGHSLTEKLRDFLQ